MNRLVLARTFRLACALLLAGSAIHSVLAQDTAPRAEAPALADRAYRQHVAETVTDRHWKAIEERGYRAQQARPGRTMRQPVNLTVYEQRDLDRQGRIAQRAHGRRLPSSATAPTIRAGDPVRPDLARSPAYRQHVAETVTDRHWKAIEERGYRAQQARPGRTVRQPVNLTVYEQRDLDRQGRIAQQARGRRLPSSAITSASPNRTARLTPARPATGNRPGSAASAAFKVDAAAQVFGGRDLGVGRLGTDLTEGQLRNALRGGDPVALAGRSVRRFGHDLTGGLKGVGQSVTDPRRIPGNAKRAVAGVANTAVDTAKWGVERTVRTGRDAGRVLTDPAFAKKQVKKAGQTARNVGQTICKGLSYLIPGGDRKKCR